MGTLGAKPRREVYVLGGIGGAFFGTVSVAMILAQKPDLHTEVLNPPQVAGEPELIRLTPNLGRASIDVPGIGQVSAFRHDPKGGAIVWLRLPNLSYDNVLVQAKFENKAFYTIPLQRSSSSSIAWGVIPGNYPKGVMECQLEVKPTNRPAHVWNLGGLPKTVANWNEEPTKASAERVGPFIVQPSVWHSQAYEGAPQQITSKFDLKATRPIDLGNWGLVTDWNYQPMYGKGLDNFVPLVEPMPLTRPTFSRTQVLDIPFASLQPSMRLTGRAARYHTYDEEVVFRHLNLTPGQMGGEPGNCYVEPVVPATFTTPSGVKITLLSASEGGDFRRFGFPGPGYVILYKISLPEGSPVEVPHPRFNAANGAKTYLSLLPDQGEPILHLSGSQNGLPVNMLVIPGAKRPPEMLADLRLTLRHRQETEAYPFSFTMRVLDSAPKWELIPTREEP